MNHETYPDSYIRGILNTVKTIAMVGISPKTSRPSYFVFKYFLERGKRMIPVNPGHAGKEILGQKVYAKLADIPEPVDMVDGALGAAGAGQADRSTSQRLARREERGFVCDARRADLRERLERRAQRPRVPRIGGTR